MKLSLPDKHVFVASGDGDLASIGGNHLIHAARRNIDLNVILVNNGIYGMTGGQTAPTTPRGVATVTSPYGALEHAFDLCPMVAAAGAAYVARWTTAHPRPLSRAIKRAIGKKGFGFVEVISQCPVQYGRASGLGKAVDILRHYKENSIRIGKTAGMEEDALGGKIVVGEFADREKEEFSSEWTRLHKHVMEG